MTLQLQYDALVTSTTGQNQFTPNGVPTSYDWCSAGRMGQGSDPGSFTAAVPWGTIYLASGSTADPSAVIEISHLKIATLSISTGQWTVREVSITGGYYVEDLVGNVSTELVDLNTDPGTITSSIPAGTTLHFFSSDRIPIDAADFGGAIVSYDAQVISASGTINATYIANSGLDYWRDMTCGYEGLGVANVDAFVGSFSPLNSGGGTIYGSTLTGPELVAAAPPSNMLPGASEPQIIHGGIEDDYLFGEIYTDTIYGNDGNDVIVGRQGGDTLYGGNGNDRLDGEIGTDNLVGGLGNDTLLGGEGNDVLRGGLGKDLLEGGQGIDVADFSDKTVKVTVTLSNGGGTATSGSEQDKLTSIESIRGGSGGDSLSGDARANHLEGNGGNDTLKGGAGDDTLVGGLGADTLVTGGGADLIVFDTTLASSNVDTISDFSHGHDHMVLDDEVFAAIGTTFTANEFWAGRGATQAHDADDHIIYNSSTGKVYYDPDGIGGADAVHFATLSTKLALDFSDFAVV